MGSLPGVDRVSQTVLEGYGVTWIWARYCVCGSGVSFHQVAPLARQRESCARSIARKYDPGTVGAVSLKATVPVVMVAPGTPS